MTNPQHGLAIYGRKLDWVGAFVGPDAAKSVR